MKKNNNPRPVNIRDEMFNTDSKFNRARKMIILVSKHDIPHSEIWRRAYPPQEKCDR
jgi:hypothetical protein